MEMDDNQHEGELSPHLAYYFCTGQSWTTDEDFEYL